MAKQQATYKIIKGKGREAIIEKSGTPYEFKYADLLEGLVNAEKTRKEIQGMVDLKKAVMENIKHFHPKVTKMNPKELDAAYMYREAKGVVGEGSKKLIQLMEATDVDLQALKDIEKQTGLKEDKPDVK